MIKEILPNLYKIEIPLPNSPLKALNSYLIKSQGRSLIIDTGIDRNECRHAMLSSLRRLDVNLEKTDFFITHLHADHLGMVSDLATDTSKIYFNERESYIINNFLSSERENLWQALLMTYLSNGFPEDESREAAIYHPGRQFGMKKDVKFSFKREGDTIEIGDYLFRCIETPGHSPGHMCLYEADKKLLVAGDHILSDITPSITFWLDMENSLEQYLASLERVYALDIKLVLPGHRRLIKNHKKRIRELQEHHQNRMTEMLSALKGGDKNTYQIAPYVTWGIDCTSWELFPPTQKWFAFGETLAHLLYLEGTGKVRKRSKGNKVQFSLA